MEESEGMGKAAHGRQGGSTHSPLALVHTGPHAHMLFSVAFTVLFVPLL